MGADSLDRTKFPRILNGVGSSTRKSLFLHIFFISFEYLDNIEKLDLSYNQLALVGSGVFRGLSRLRQLYLHNNRLTVVQQGSLDMLPGLEVHEHLLK